MMALYRESDRPGLVIRSSDNATLPDDHPEYMAWLAGDNTPDPSAPLPDLAPDPVAVAAQAAAVAVAADPSIGQDTKLALGALVAAIVAERGGTS